MPIPPLITVVETPEFISRSNKRLSDIEREEYGFRRLVKLLVDPYRR